MTVHTGDSLYRTADGRIVAEGDPDAAFLVVANGSTIPAEYASAVKAYRADPPAVFDEPTPSRSPFAIKRGGPSEDK